MSVEELQRMRKAYRRLAGRWAWNVLSLAGFQGAEARIRRRAVARLQLQPGDAVLDVACGRGSNFPTFGGRWASKGA
jgi:ubiquinone/menaquinone biosynthesis C-methylase UbiE